MSPPRRLPSDGEARFQRDPVATTRQAGLPELAQEIAQGDDGLEGLEGRESHSSLAGVLTSLAIEGAVVFGSLHEHLGAEAAAAAVPSRQRDQLFAASAPAAEAAGHGEADDADDDEDHDPGEDVDEDGEDGPDGDDGDDEDDGDDGDDEDDGDDDSQEPDVGGSDSDDPNDAFERALPDPGDLGDAPTAYPGDDAPRERVAAWMARAAQKRGLPPELPVMASLVESNMHNLSYGDADSVGFFQMRTSIWNQGEYAGYGERPQLQLEWFLDHAAAVRDQRVARGLPVDDPRQFGEWIADVERPAAQFRGRYQLRLDDARELLAAFAPQEAAPHAGARARSMMGVEYEWGGSTPQEGFDCSGLVQWAYAKAGISLPRTTDQQFAAPGGIAVKRRDLLPGDLVFFRDTTGYIHHVGISLGGDRFVNAPHRGSHVEIDTLDNAYWSREFAGGRRFDHVLGSGRAEA